MTHQLRHVVSRVPLGVMSFTFGSVLAGIVVAAPPPDPAPNVPLAVRERNLDANGWIMVHEQGTTNVSGTVDVEGDIAISNFPETQNVNVTGGQIDLTSSPVTTGFSEEFCNQPAQLTEFPLPSVINATNLSVSTFTDETSVYFRSPIPMEGTGFFGATVFSYRDASGEKGGIAHAFTRPVPISSVRLQCLNESDLCCALVDIIGDSAQ